MDLTGWVEYFVTGLATQMQEVRERGERVMRMDLLAQKHRLTERQQGILQLFLDHKSLAISTVEARYPQIHRRTLQRDLKVLIDKDLIGSSGATNNLIYAFQREKTN